MSRATKLTDRQKDRIRLLAWRLTRLVNIDAPFAVVENELAILRSILYPFGVCEACGYANLAAGNCSREQCYNHG